MPSLFLGLTDWIASVIASGGYGMIFALMILEGVITPIPSEFIMPFAGYLSATGQFHLAVVVAVGTAGAAIGNTVAYYIGARVGRPLVDRYGRYIAIGPEDLRWAEAWFAKWGDAGVLIGHAVPGIRSFISFPAGIGKMRLRNFVAFSTIGAAIWNSVLVLAGYFLLQEWRLFAETTENVDLYVVVAAIAAVLGYVYWRKWRARKRAQARA